MLERRGRIEALGATVVVVVCDEPARVRAGVLQGLELPWPVVVDTSRQAYRAWGLRRATSVATWLSASNIRGYGRMVLGRGERLARPGADPLQLGGDFVVAPDGRVAYARAQSAAHDRPPVSLLLKRLAEAADYPCDGDDA